MYVLALITLFVHVRCTQDGINWLAFLNKYNLHGILGDGIHDKITSIYTVHVVPVAVRYF